MNDYKHQPVNHSAKQFVNGIDPMWAIPKRMHYGTYHHFSVEHMPRYVNEYAFRLNEGHVGRKTIGRIDAVIAKSSSHA